jgi:hypothetical protein
MLGRVDNMSFGLYLIIADIQTESITRFITEVSHKITVHAGILEYCLTEMLFLNKGVAPYCFWEAGEILQERYSLDCA